MRAGSRPYIHDIIRCTHGILIMLHNYERISQILKIHKCAEQLVVIPLMQSNTWLIKYICHTYKP